ncbi:MAG: vWA domain-containing protein [Myxococcota bacterium]
MNTHLLRRLDLVFCVDLTGSMGGLIASARAHVGRVLDALRTELHDELHVGFVGYRDHSDGPDKLLHVEPLTSDVERVRRVIDAVKVDGGGDAPEAVYAGLVRCLELPWREGSYRVVILIGDAPPHAVGAPGDAWPHVDPTGLSLDDMANRMETEGLFVHALSLTPQDKVMESAFRRLSISTGGTYADARSPDAAMRLVETITRQLLVELDFDRRLLTRLAQGVVVPEPRDENELVPTRDEVLAKALDVPVQQVWAGLMRLRRRRLFTD